MNRLLPALAVVLTLAPVAAQAMPVSEFLEEASDIPHNPTALVRADTRRLMGEIRAAIDTIGSEREAALAAGRTPAFCPPEHGRVSISADDILARFNAIPASRRHISVTQAMREWMADRYPC